MKLIIQIPCLNEEEALPQAVRDLPTAIPGIDTIERLVIDDGSTDKTVEVARQLGIEHIVRHTTNKGLAAAFQTGLNAALQLGADVVVNTDADNQYPGRLIPELVRPILVGQADMVIGDRQVNRIEEFSFSKKVLQKAGSAVVRYVSGTDVPDAPSGFRALSREAALRINVLSGYTYTLETIIQAGKNNLTIAQLPIETNPKVRDSRLVKGNFRYVLRSTTTILRLFVLYEPLRTFAYLSVPFLLFGSALWIRYLVLAVMGQAGEGAHVSSVVAGAVSILVALLLCSLGLIGELLATNRRIIEQTLYYTKRAALADQKMEHRNSTTFEGNDKGGV